MFLVIAVFDYLWILLMSWIFLQILCDLLSPADENVKVGLRETTQNTLPHLRSKHLVTEAQTQSPSQRQKQQHQVRAASAHQVDGQEVPTCWMMMLRHWNVLLLCQCCIGFPLKLKESISHLTFCHLPEAMRKPGAARPEPSPVASNARL